MRLGAALVYVALMVGVVVMANAGIHAAFPVWVAASFCLGWVTRSPWLAFLPFLAAAIAVPFGFPDISSEGDPLVLWSEFLLVAPIQAAIVLAGFGARRLYKRSRASAI